MTACSVYVGDVGEFDMKGAVGAPTWCTHLPPAVTDAFPPVGNCHYHEALDGWCDARKVTQTQTDFDGYVAPVTKAQVLDFISFWYDSDPIYTDPEEMKHWEHLVKRLDKIRAQASALNEHGKYGLVSYCY